MQHLERFIDGAEAAGARFRQDFPPDCIPIQRGEPMLPIDGLVSDLE
jgi:hypothetical protein